MFEIKFYGYFSQESDKICSVPDTLLIESHSGNNKTIHGELAFLSP